VRLRDDFGERHEELGTTAGSHQRVNSWPTAAPDPPSLLRSYGGTSQRGRLSWGLLIAGLVRSAISRPLDLLSRFITGATFFIDGGLSL
jgi:hypothetical protein